MKKIDSKLVLHAYFAIYFTSKTTVIKEKRKALFNFYYRNGNTHKFLAFAIKNDSGNVTKSDEFRFEKTLGEEKNV